MFEAQKSNCNKRIIGGKIITNPVNHELKTRIMHTKLLMIVVYWRGLHMAT
ncbi:rCG64237 [Rattus norvegicus]|uniref:RCG64237 n=1 Tax=Rattus norvegicus TaxID=10116 RepID=A6K827_RAT|nr:rCG64237 [Rattus norvegicus]